MVNLILEIAAFFLVLFFLVPFLFFSFWLHHIANRDSHGPWHDDDTAPTARH